MMKGGDEDRYLYQDEMEYQPNFTGCTLMTVERIANDDEEKHYFLSLSTRCQCPRVHAHVIHVDQGMCKHRGKKR